MDEHLERDNYVIFRGDASEFTTNAEAYAFGFVSPIQLAQLQHSRTVCMDATHKVTDRLTDIMYTIVTRDPYTGCGYPVAYMFTNDLSSGPIHQWLEFLRNTYGMDIVQMTIDCSIPEVNAIQAQFPGVGIHYCAFHVLQAWNRNLKSRVRLDASFTADEQREYRHEMLNALTSIMRETDVDRLYHAIQQFQSDYHEQEEFQDYLERWWFTEATIQRWTYAYAETGFRSMMTNNFIESWHNQLKSVYLRNQRNRRLDRLFFVLTHDVEYFMRNERDRIVSNNGRMGPLENELSVRRFRASRVNPEAIVAMICNPEGEHSSSPMTGTWKVNSFGAQSSEVYDVAVSDGLLILSCTCEDYQSRRTPCKHMFLLKRFTSMQILFETEQQNAIELVAQAVPFQHSELQDAEDMQIVEVNDEPIEILDDAADSLQFVEQNVTALYHDRAVLSNMPHIPQEEAAQLAQRVRELASLYEDIKRRYYHTRRSTTQRR